MIPVRLKLFYYLPLAVWMAVIFVASTGAGSARNTSHLLLYLLSFARDEVGSVIRPETLQTLNYLARKSAHVTEYAVLTALAVRAIQFGSPRLKAKAVIGALLISLFYAAGDEFHQRFVANRTSTPIDVAIDMVGASLVMVVILIWFLAKALEYRMWRRPLPSAFAEKPHAVVDPHPDVTAAGNSVPES